MKIATWNVNGIRARQAQVRSGSRGSGRHRVPAGDQGRPDQLPVCAVRARGLLVLLARRQGLLGRGAARAQPLRRSGRRSPSRRSTTRTASSSSRSPGITVASVYVPNGGKDFPAKMQFLEALERSGRGAQRRATPLVICGDLNVARTDWTCIRRSASRRDRSAARGARAARADPRARAGRRRARRSIPTTTSLFTWWAPWRNLRQRNIGWRLDYVLASRALFARGATCVVQADVGTSDHAPVIAVFSE